MKIRKLFSATVAFLALSLSASFAADTKVGFVYVGPINDGGWTQIHHENALVMKEYFGDQVEMVYQENVPEGADSERVMTQMALSGADLIFTTSYNNISLYIFVLNKNQKNIKSTLIIIFKIK